MEYKTECPQCGAKIAFCADYCAECESKFESRLERDWAQNDSTQLEHWVESLNGERRGVAVPGVVAEIVSYYLGAEVFSAQYFPETSTSGAEVHLFRRNKVKIAII